jgi:hypothetical protein
VATPHCELISAPRSAERVTTPATRRRSGAERAMRRKNSERQPLPMMPNVVGVATASLSYSGIDVSALGFGCWAIGGPFGPPGQSSGWGEVDDTESVAALRRALELGVTFFDTADVYGTGHSEELLGSVVAADRDRVVIATKFGNTFDEGTGVMTGQDVSAASIRSRVSR